MIPRNFFNHVRTGRCNDSEGQESVQAPCSPVAREQANGCNYIPLGNPDLWKDWKTETGLQVGEQGETHNGATVLQLRMSLDHISGRDSMPFLALVNENPELSLIFSNETGESCSGNARLLTCVY